MAIWRKTAIRWRISICLVTVKSVSWPAAVTVSSKRGSGGGEETGAEAWGSDCRGGSDGGGGGEDNELLGEVPVPGVGRCRKAAIALSTVASLPGTSLATEGRQHTISTRDGRSQAAQSEIAISASGWLKAHGGYGGYIGYIVSSVTQSASGWLEARGAYWPALKTV